MKTTIITISILLLFSCTSEHKYSIVGTLAEDQGKEWMYLQKLWSQELQVDSARIEDGKFSFSGIIEVPEIYGIFHPSGSQGVCTFILEPSDLKMELDPESWYNDGTKVTGGPYNDEFNRVHKVRMERYHNEIEGLSSKLLEAGEEEQNDINQKIQQLRVADTKYVTDYIENNPNSPVSVNLLMWQFYQLPLDMWGQLLSVLSPDMKSTSVYKDIESRYQTQLALKDNTPAMEHKGKPSFLEVDFTNKSIIESLVDINPGKILYVNVWSTICSPCLRELPYSRELHAKMDQQVVAFIYLCTNTKNEEDWKEMIDIHNLDGQHFLLNRKLCSALYKELGGVKGYYYFIVGSDGKIAYENAPRPSSEEIEKILNELTP